MSNFGGIFVAIVSVRFSWCFESPLLDGINHLGSGRTRSEEENGFQKFRLKPQCK